MQIVAYIQEYAEQITDLFHDTIHQVCSEDYTAEELDVWAPTPMDYDRWASRLERTKPLVAIKNDKVVGFGELESNGHIDCFYIHKDHQRSGIGRALMDRIEENAKRNVCAKLFAEVSITAKPFFLKMGFRTCRPNLVVIGHLLLKNYLMEKVL
jgi:putative acetyltransferase